MRKSLSVTLFTLVLLTLVVCSGLSLGAAAPTAALQTQRLTDRDSSEYHVLYQPVPAAGKNSAHVVWREYVHVDPPNTFDSGLYYARLPTGQVKELSWVTGTSVASQPAPKIMLDENDKAYVIWVGGSETSEGGDLFFWKTGMNASVLLSDHEQSDGNVGQIHLVVDDDNAAHVLWAESTIGNTIAPRIFYWTEGSSVSKLSVGDYDGGGFNVTDAFGLATVGGIVHALWQDLDTTTPGGAEPYYWNSNDQTAVSLRAGLAGDEGFLIDFFLNQNGVLHALWRDQLAYPSELTEYRHWDSTSQTNHLVFSTDEVVEWPQLAQDGDGNAHIVWKTGGDCYHWDSANQSVGLIPGLNDSPLILNGKVGNHIHVLWLEADGNWPGHLDDVFYWRPGMAQALNITDHFGTQANAEITEFVVDETDVAHVYWSEDDLFYFNTAISTTVALTTTIPTSGRSRTDLASYDDMLAASGGVGYVLVPTGETETPFMVWQSDTYTYTQVSAIYEPASAPEKFMLWLDSNDQAQVAWLDAGPAGEGSNLHYWNAADGSQDLTDISDTDGDCDSIWISGLADESGRVYLLWNEDGIGDDDESDLYAAYLPIEYTDFVYLPLVLNGSGQ